MPFHTALQPSTGIRAGIWEITESTEDLLRLVVLDDREKVVFAGFRNDLRKRQWLACRALLAAMLHPSPVSGEIRYDAHGKPSLRRGMPFLSLSHAGTRAALALSDRVPVGIDIEAIRDRIERVKERFLTPRELASIDPADRLGHLCLLWGAKEALYKLNGMPGADFRNDFEVEPFDYLCTADQYCRAIRRLEGASRECPLYCHRAEGYMTVVAYEDQPI